MDARITKSRLSNLLSYDWLKMLVTIVAAVLAVSLIFTVAAPRAKDKNTFTVFAYNDLVMGEDAETLNEDLSSVLSYDIEKTASEKFAEESGSGLYKGTIYTTRLTDTARTVMFVHAAEEYDTDGYTAVKTLFNGNAGRNESEEKHGFLNFETYLNDCRAYLNQFFGDYKTGALDVKKAEDCFYARNAKDRRYRSEAKKQAGAKKEIERFKKLREDFLAVEQAFEAQTLSYSYFKIDEEHADEESGYLVGEYNCGVNLGKLTNLRNLYYAWEKDGEQSYQTASKLSLILFNTATLSDKSNDLRYETISFLSYLLEKYGD